MDSGDGDFSQWNSMADYSEKCIAWLSRHSVYANMSNENRPNVITEI